MPYANSGGVKLYYEEVGAGTAIIFLHEFAGDYRSWEPQMRFFSSRYHCVCYNARGYPPSDIPTSISEYNQENQADDAANILDALGIEKAHIVGLSMGGFAALHFGLRHPQRALSLAVTGCGYGANKDNRNQFMNDAEKVALEYDNNGSKAVADFYSVSSTRVQFQNKNPPPLSLKITTCASLVYIKNKMCTVNFFKVIKKYLLKSTPKTAKKKKNIKLFKTIL